MEQWVSDLKGSGTGEHGRSGRRLKEVVRNHAIGFTSEASDRTDKDDTTDMPDTPDV